MKYLVLIGILLVGATGKFINGPWLINKLPEFVSNRLTANNLSPVIFGKIDIFARLILSPVTTSKFNF